MQTDAALESRLRSIEDVQAIEYLEGRYAETWDFGDAEGWAELFAEDGVFEMLAPDGSVTESVQGTHELRAFCETFTGDVLGLHLLHAPRITVTGDTATSHIHFTFESQRTTPIAIEMATVTGIYRVTYRRTEAGWRMQRRSECAMNRSLLAHHPSSFSR